MTGLEESVLVFEGYAPRRSVCHAMVARDRGVVLGELEDNEGTSLTNALEVVCAGVSGEWFSGEIGFEVFEWLPVDIVTRESALLRIHWHYDGFRMPEWTVPSALPDWVAHATSRIEDVVPYTAESLQDLGVARFEMTDARDHLARLRQQYPHIGE